MKCRRCSRNAITELKYFKEPLCGRCFNDLFEKRVKKSIRVNRLLGKRDRVVVGLSGRRDSMTLLFLFDKIFFKAPKSKLIAVTVDDSKGRVKFTRKFCRKLGVEYHSVKLDRKLGLWGTLDKKARVLNADKIALGVNLEDEVLAVLEGIMRGESSKARRGLKVIKPLGQSLEKEVMLYAKNNGVKYIKEKKEEDDFRKTLRRMLNEIESKQPGSKFKLLKSVDSYRETLT